MMMRIKIAWRNILRHRNRTLINLLMISSAVISQVVFSGFAENILRETRQIMIDTQYGHMQIAEKDFWELKPGKRKEQLIANAEEVSAAMSRDPDISTISGRLSFFGLLSTGEITVSAKGMGYDPAKEIEFGRNLTMEAGHGLSSDAKLEVNVGGGLAKKLSLKSGDEITALSYTLDGVVNAMDLRVTGLFSTGNSEVDDNLFFVPLATAQTLLDTDRVELLAVRLKETEATHRVRPRLQSIASSIKPSLETKTWYELANFYRQAEAFFAVQNSVIQAILLSLIFLGILNTIGMSVYERTGEIGTIRSLGETPNAVVGQFLLEGCLFGILGSGLGIVLGWVISHLITAAQFGMNLPGTSVKCPIVIDVLPLSYLEATFVAIAAALAASCFPAMRASKLTIVEALKRNI